MLENVKLVNKLAQVDNGVIVKIVLGQHQKYVMEKTIIVIYE